MASEADNYKRLEGEHQKGLVDCLQRIKQYKDIRENYVALKERLTTISDKLSHDVMVPLGEHAFMPGKLVHTNNITVLLGDDWFAEVTAKQAADIVDRRIKHCDTILEKLAKEEEQFENWLGYISDISNNELCEIREEYDSEREELWREQHAQNLLEDRRKNAGGKVHRSKRKQNADSDYYFNRLDELALEEQDKHELYSTDSENDDDDDEDEEDLSIEADVVDQNDLSETCENSKEEKSDQFQKENNADMDDFKNNSSGDATIQLKENDDHGKKFELAENDHSHCASDKHVRWIDLSEANSKKITFKHTTIKPVPQKGKKHRKRRNSSTSSISEEDQDDKTPPIINSPSDIYKCFSFSMQQSKPKSILKPMNSSSFDDSTPPSSVESRDSLTNGESVQQEDPFPILTSDTTAEKLQAFTGEIRETLANGEVSLNMKTEERPKSVFKSKRQNKR